MHNHGRSFWFLSTMLLFMLCITSQEADAQEPQTKAFRDTLSRAQAKTQSREWAEAASLWEIIVQMNPVEGEFWGQLAEAYYQNKEYRKAAQAYEKALDLGDGLPSNANYNIARCYAQLGDKDQAMKWLEKSFDLGFRSLTKAQTDADLQSLRNDARFRKLTAMEDVSKLSRDDGWRYDLQLLAREVKRRRYYPFLKISKEEFDLSVKQIHDWIPRLTDIQVTIEMMKLMRKVGDGHTMLYAFWERPEFLKTIPVDLQFFREGLFITAADSRYTDLLGAQVLRFDNLTVEEVLQGLDPILNRDNQRGPLVLGLMRIRNLPLLHGLGLIRDPEHVSLTIRDAQGKTRAVLLPADSGVPSRKLWDGLPKGWKTFYEGLPGQLPIYLKNNYADYWFEYMPETKTVYFQFNRVHNDPQEPLTKFCDRLFKFINEHEVNRLVVDMRWNPGGDTTISLPLIWGLVRCEKINERGKLFVIIGGRTYSAAQNVATFIERNTKAIFVGEPTGSGPNFIGEDNPFELPYSKIMANVSEFYWQSSWPFDHRTWIAPLLYTPPTFEAYSKNRDLAMEAILAY